MEHRWGHRRDINRPVQVNTRGGILSRGRITNVSISGAYIVTPLPVPMYSDVEVQFTAMLAGKRTITSVEAQVVRRDKSGIGIEWRELAPEAVRALVMVPPFRAAEASSHQLEWMTEGRQKTRQQQR